MAIVPTHHGDLSFSSSPLAPAGSTSDTTGDDWAILVINNFNATLANITSILYNGTEHVGNLRLNAATAHITTNFHGVCAFKLGADAGNHVFSVVWTGGGLIDFQWVSGTGTLDNAVYDGAATSTESTSSAGTDTPTPYTSTTAGALPFFLYDSNIGGGGSGTPTANANCTRYQISGLVSQQQFYYCPLATASGSTSAVLNSAGSSFNLTFAMALKPSGAATGSVGASSGVATALAVGAALALSVGSAAGVAVASGIAPSGGTTTITLTGTNAYFSGVGQLYPYTAALSGLTTVNVAGTYTGSPPTHVQYRLGGTGSFATVGSEVIGGGNWSGTIPNVAIGDVRLEIQESNNSAVNIDITNIKTTLGLGDIFGIIGDSEGLMPNAGNVTASAAHGHTRYLHNGNQWVDWDATPEAERGAWAYFGNEVTAQRSAPCFILNGAAAGTSLSNWRHGVSTFDSAVAGMAAANGGLTAIICANLGTNDARQGNGLVQSIVTAQMQATAADCVTYMPPFHALFWAGVAELDTNVGSGNLRAELDTVRKSLTATVASGSALFGGFLQDQVYLADGLHPDANDLADIGRRHFLAVTDTLYGTSVGTGPRVSNITIDGTKKILIVTVDRDLSNTISSSVAAFVVKDGGTSVTISSQVVTAIRAITLTLPVAIAGTATVDFASGNDAKGATVPVRAVETLPSGATTQRILQYFSDQPVILPGSAVGSAVGAGVAIGRGAALASAVGLVSGTATVIGFIPVPFSPSSPMVLVASRSTTIALKASVN